MSKATSTVYLVENDYLGQDLASDPQEDTDARKFRIMKQTMMVFLSSLGMWSIGSVNTYTSILAYDLRNYNTTIYGDTISITDPQLDLLSSLKTISALPGTWVFAAVTIMLGRRLCMIIAGLLMAAGWLAIILTPDVTGMMIARVLSGVGIGGLSVCVNSYCIEIPDPDRRGAMALIVNTGILVGHFLTMCLGYGFRYYTVGLINLCIPVIFLLSIIWLPESPSVLVIKGHTKKAEVTLKELRGQKADIKAEIEKYIEKNKVNEAHQSPWKELITPEVLKSLARVCLLFVLMQFTGYMVVTSNASRMFQDAGSTIDDNLAAVIITSVQLLSSIAAFFSIDRLGRKRSLMLSFGFMCVPLVIMVIYTINVPLDIHGGCYLQNDCPTSKYGWIPLVCLMISQVAVVFGVNPIPYILSNEYFPTFIRSQASSVCYTVGTVVGFIVLQFFTPMLESMTQTGLYAFYASVCAIGIPYTFFFIKETAGQSVG